MQDQNFITLFFNKSIYRQYKNYINPDLLNKEMKELFYSLDKFYKEHEVEQVKLEEFTTWFLQFHKKNITEEAKELYRYLFKKLEECKNQNNDMVLADLKKKDLFYKIQEVVEKDGLTEDIDKLITKYHENQIEELEPCSDKLSDVLARCQFETGLKWRLPSLNEFIHPLDRGVFGVVAALPNAGKTSFLASEVSHMAKQLTGNESVLWFNNEGIKEFVKERIYSATFKKPFKDIVEAYQAGQDVDALYLKRMNGQDRILIYDIHGYGMYDIEAVIKRHNPKLIILDMLDHLTAGSSGKAKHNIGEAYQELYQWARYVAAKYAPVLGTSQVRDMTQCKEYRQMYPLMEDLYQSKTAKQGASVFQLMIGCPLGQQGSPLRYLSTPKNKYNSKGLQFKHTVNFDFETSLFEEI